MIEILRERRSCREYTEQPVESNKLNILQESVLRSPSSKNINPWVFIFVDDKNTIKRLKACKSHGVTPLQTAPLAVVICADETLNDVWVEDCSVASILLQLTAQSLGLGSCWIQIRNRKHSDDISSEEFVSDLLQIPENYRVLSIITVGYPAMPRKGKPFNELQVEKIKVNKF